MNPPSHDDRERLEDWVRNFGPAVQGYLTAMVRDRHLAEDLAQEVFHRAWRNRDRYEEQGSAKAYLMKIADRLALDRLRAPKRETQFDDEGWRRSEVAGPVESPGDRIQRQESAAQLHAALDQLSELQKRVLMMRYYSDMSFGDIAAVLEIPLGTALSHSHRALAALRKLLP